MSEKEYWLFGLLCNVFVVKLRRIFRNKLALLMKKGQSICKAKIDGYSFAYDFAVRSHIYICIKI